MKLAILLPFALLAGTPAFAASPFDGTWKTDISKISLPAKPDEYLLKGGSFTCHACTPGFTVAADGKPHPVTGHDYFDSFAAHATGPRTVETIAYLKGKPVGTTDFAVSADDRTLTMTGKRVNAATGVTANSVSTATRVAPAPAGAHPMSGSWKAQALKSASDSAMTQSFKVTGDTVTLSTPTGEGYTAVIDGPPVLQKNDVGKTMISLKRPAPNHLIETDSRNGKVVQVYDMTVKPDGRTMVMAISDKRDGTTTTVTMLKQ